MCVVSMVGDHFTKKFEPYTNQPSGAPGTPFVINFDGVTREEFEQLKRDVLEMKELLKAAKKYDEEHDQPDCEMEDKVEVLRAVAEALGVDLPI